MPILVTKINGDVIGSVIDNDGDTHRRSLVLTGAKPADCVAELREKIVIRDRSGEFDLFGDLAARTEHRHQRFRAPNVDP